MNAIMPRPRGASVAPLPGEGPFSLLCAGETQTSVPGLGAYPVQTSVLLGRFRGIEDAMARAERRGAQRDLCADALTGFMPNLLLLQDARRSFGSWSLLAVSSSASVVVLLVVALALREPFWPGDWTPVVMLAISSQLVGQGLLVYSLKLFPPLVIGIALLTQPAVAALVGWLAFGEWLVPLDVLGIVLVGSALVLARVTAPKEPPRPRVNPV